MFGKNEVIGSKVTWFTLKSASQRLDKLYNFRSVILNTNTSAKIFNASKTIVGDFYHKKKFPFV